MRIAVIGGTGLVGRHTVEALRRAGHEAVVVTRSRGIIGQSPTARSSA